MTEETRTLQFTEEKSGAFSELTNSWRILAQVLMMVQVQSHMLSDLILTAALRCVSHPHFADGERDSKSFSNFSSSHSKASGTASI